MTSDAPWLDVDCTVSTPLTPSRALTTGTETWLSTMSGDAPGSGVMTITAGIEMSGRRSCCTWDAAYMPAPKSSATPSITTAPRWRDRRVKNDKGVRNLLRFGPDPGQIGRASCRERV